MSFSSAGPPGERGLLTREFSSMKHLTCLFVVAAWVMCAGCGGGAKPDGKSEYSGTVTWNGAPLPKGSLTLYSEKGATDAADIEGGTFTIRTTPGAKSVSVTAEKELGTPPPTERIPNPSPVKFQYLPRDVNADSKLKQTLSAEAKEPLKIELAGKELAPPKDALKAQPD